MCIRRETRKKARRSLAFPPVSKLHTHITWFNVECKLARQNYRKLRRKYKKNQTEKNKEELNNSEKYYKRTLDKNQKLYSNKITKTVEKFTHK